MYVFCVVLIAASLLLSACGVNTGNGAEVPQNTPVSTQVGATQPTAIDVPNKPVTWKQVTLGRWFEIQSVNGEMWELVMGTHMSTDLDRRDAGEGYYAVEPGLAGPQGNGQDLGWCKKGQPDCPTHLQLHYSEVSNASAQMKIATLWTVQPKDGIGFFRYNMMFNHETRTDAELVKDYDVAASQGELGLFIATLEPGMEPLKVTYEGKEYVVGYACSHCAAHTSGSGGAIVPLTDIETFGPEVAPLGNSLYPGYVIPIPSPKDDPDFKITDLMIEIPEGSVAVLWYGRYDPNSK